MTRQSISEGELYTGTAREILSLYKSLKERNIYNRPHEGYLKVSTSENYGLVVRRYNSEVTPTIMVVSAPIALRLSVSGVS